MKKTALYRVIAIILTFALSLTMIGCGSSTDNSKPITEATPTVPVEIKTEESASPVVSEPVSKDEIELSEEVPIEIPAETSNPFETEQQKAEEEAQKRAEEEAKQKAEEEAQKKAEEEAKKKAEEEAKQEEEKKLAEQRNSFSMMYYLAITAEEIRTSKDNRLALENIYTSLLNDVNPGAIDEITQDHLKNLRDIIKSYLDISTKRERLEFVYNQEKAASIRSAVPNPLAVLSLTSSLNWRKLATSIVYSVVDSYTNYKKSSDTANMNYIMSGWELDDEEKETVMKNRDRAFDYMVDMVQEYELDGMKTLSEKAIEKFAEICTIENAAERIKLLRAEESSYELLGNYWLELADAYFEECQYDKCLECVSKYNELSTGIYRKDYNYLQILPKAIVAAQKTYTTYKYITYASKYADDIISNTSTDDWSSRYFAAQVYLDLYAKTNKQTYLEKAYKIATENVTSLLKSQRSINTTYLNDVVEQTVEEPDYKYLTNTEKKEKKKEYNNQVKQAEAYNKALKESRKTELPTLYEPLILNCELMFALADKMEISDSEKSEIEKILQTESNGIFMVKPINDFYSFTHADNKYSIDFNQDEILIPASLLTAESKIVVTVKQNGETFTYDDCVVEKVERESDNIDSFVAHVVSKQLKKHEWAPDSNITVTITYGDAYDKSISFNFTVSEYSEFMFFRNVSFKAK